MVGNSGIEGPVSAFNEPVLRCDSCANLVKLETLHKIGCCNHCGNKRIRNVTVFNEDEKAQIEEWGFTDFLDEFGVVDE